ncbi:MAG TPA: YciI family protein, partial [Polyangia bacterium]
INFSGGKARVVDGPFAEAKELIAGYWIIQVKSREEAIEWAKRIPAELCNVPEVELRPFYELEDFAPGPAVAAAKERRKDLPADAAVKR